jgi:16S rRNA (cytidine1402-2'-O)-methyltransferase
VIVIHPSAASNEEDSALSPQALSTLKLLLDELPLKTAVKLAAEITKANRNTLYEKALALKEPR